MTLDLFDSLPGPGGREAMGAQAFVLRGLARPSAPSLVAEIARLERVSPFRHMVTPGGFTMSVALTNCGALGWTSDASGYRYTRVDPQTGAPWPAMPSAFRELARTSAAAAGFDAFEPDSCLINRYLPGTRLTLHQDKNERDFGAPIVSVSLGIAATFLFGGHDRREKPRRVSLIHGDVAVWGGVDRLRYHGVMPIKAASHLLLGEQRLNFTFRKAG